MRKSANTTEIAEKAGVSRSTVSCVLNGRSKVRISQETIVRVHEAANQLGYRRNNLSWGLIRGKTETIGVLVPLLDVSYFGRIAQGILHEADVCGYRVMQAISRRDPDADSVQAGRLLEHRVDGILCVLGGFTTVQAKRWLTDVVRDDAPCVFVGERTHSDIVDCVFSDDVIGAEEIVRHLINLGHRRIAHITGSFEQSTAYDRLEGYKSAMAQAGIAIDDDLIVNGQYCPEDVIRSSETLLSLADRPTAIFASTDYDAAIAMDRIRLAGLRVPEDMAVVGFSNAEMAPYLGLTTVDQKPFVIGQTAIRTLLMRIADREGTPREIAVPTNLIVRRTCGANRDWCYQPVPIAC